MTVVDGVERNIQKQNVQAGIVGIGTATPPVVRQDQAARLAEELANVNDDQRKWLRRVFERCGVEKRGSVLLSGEMDAVEELQRFYRGNSNGPTTGERMGVYAQKAGPLAERAGRAALESAGVDTGRITHLVTASCTGFFAPGIDSELIVRLGLTPDVQRTHIGFMGCHAAFNALGVAEAIVKGHPEAVVLVCCVELCSLHFAYGWDPQKLVANALFGDGAAAAVVGNVSHESELRQEGDGGGWELRGRASLLLGGSADAMRWKIGDHGFEMTLSPELPGMVEKELFRWVSGWSQVSVGGASGASWAVHPGGPRILSAVRDALGLAEEDLRFSRAVLAAHGNMSSTTVLFILQEMARAGVRGPCVALGFGPGLTMEGMLLRRFH